MGNTWEILVWIKDEYNGTYDYDLFWKGENIVAMIWNLLKAKRAGHGCVTLHWR